MVFRPFETYKSKHSKAPKVRNIIAQGKALGKEKKKQSPKAGEIKFSFPEKPKLTALPLTFRGHRNDSKS
jgi:hypothetical protein